MKRALIILAVVLAIAGIVYAGYLLSTRKAAPPPAETIGLPEAGPREPGAEPGGAPGAPEGLRIVGNEQFFSFGVASDTSLVAAGLDGKIFTIPASGSSASPVGSAALDNFVSAEFSDDAQKIVFSFGSPEARQFSVFDLKTKSWTPLQNSVVAAAWKPKSHTLAYASEKNGLKTVFSLDLDSSKAKPQQLFSLRMEDLVLDWISPTKISVGQRPSAFASSFAIIFDTAKKTFSSPVAGSAGLSLLWDSSASRALEFTAGPTARGGEFRIISSSGEVMNRFEFLTLPEKCLFVPAAVAISTTSAKSAPAAFENEIICAVPSDQSSLSKSAVPDEYYRRGIFTSDDIYKIDLEEGTASLLLSSSKNFDVQNPVLFGGTLFFLNRSDNKIYSLEIPKEP